MEPSDSKWHIELDARIDGADGEDHEYNVTCSSTSSLRRSTSSRATKARRSTLARNSTTYEAVAKRMTDEWAKP